ncbi:flagellar protein FliT [Sodalis ligni]|nr:flagellar protein FliT [Sodalis ligni]
MDACPSLLAHYQQILVLSENMLLMARQSEWDTLVYIEEKYVHAVAKISELNASQENSLPGVIQDKIALLLRQLLKNETEVNELLQARLNQLRDLIGQSNRQQTVNSTYHKFSDRASMLPGEIKNNRMKNGLITPASRQDTRYMQDTVSNAMPGYPAGMLLRTITGGICR